MLQLCADAVVMTAAELDLRKIVREFCPWLMFQLRYCLRRYVRRAQSVVAPPAHITHCRTLSRPGNALLTDFPGKASVWGPSACRPDRIRLHPAMQPPGPDHKIKLIDVVGGRANPEIIVAVGIDLPWAELGKVMVWFARQVKLSSTKTTADSRKQPRESARVSISINSFAINNPATVKSFWNH